jgi:hypothetical protein
MKTMRRFSPLIFGLLSVSFAVAQGTDCPAFVEQAMDTVGATCQNLGRNQVCYGSTSIDAQFDTADVRFDIPGDRAGVLDLQRLVTAPLVPQDQIWGVAVLSLQANLPDSLPGENATFVVFGDTELTLAAEPGYDAPMQAFTLTTRLSGIECEDMADSGVLVQAPENTTVNFMINGVEVSVGSSALLQVEDGDLVVDTVEGFVQVTSGGATEVVGEGLTTRARRGRRPLRAAITRSRRVLNAPWRLLPRQVRAFPPIPTGQTVSLNDCFYANAQRAAQNPVRVRAGEDVVLRLSVAHASLDIARILQQRTRNQLSINGAATPPYTRIGPWHGESDQYGEFLGIEWYWLIEAPAAGTLRILLESETDNGRPIATGIDGADPDSEPEIIPARRRIFCAVQVGS